MRTSSPFSDPSPPESDDEDELPPEDPEEEEVEEEGDDFSEPPPDDEFSEHPPSDEEQSIKSDEDDFEEEPSEEESIEESRPSEDTEQDLRASQQRKFVLPVTTASRVKIESDDASSSKNFRLEPLTAGLIVKEPPQLLLKSIAPQRSEAVVRQDLPQARLQHSSNVEEEETPNKDIGSDLAELISAKNERKNSLLRKGFVEVKGRFDGDSFEDLLLNINKETKRLTVVVETGESATFDLSRKAFVFEDTEDPTTFILEYQRNIIVFKFASAESLINVMKSLPDEVFMAAELLQEEETENGKIQKSVEEEKKLSTKSKPPPPKSPKAFGTGPKIDHVKGTSVEDILENDFETSAERKEKIEQMFQVRDNALISAVPVPKRRKELIENYLRKPKYSVRRVTLICEWINSLKVWPKKLMIISLHKELCTGMLLANLFKYLKPDVEYVNMHEKALVKKAALGNLEQVLGHIWRAKSLNNSRIPTAEEIYSGNTSKTAILLNELFAVYILRPLYKNALKILRWYHNILKQYQRPLPDYIFEDGDLAGVWPHFQSGTALFCVIYHFYGATSIGKGTNVHHVDPLRISGDPTSICDFRSNLLYVFQLLGLLDIDVLWTAEDWISNPDTEFIMFQLSIIFEKLRDKQCTLPPAHGDKPGLTSGPNGDALVIGLIFSDAPANIKFLPKTRKAVRLGHDQDSMHLLPVDQSFLNPRFTAGGVLPQGMISKNARIAQVLVDLKESKLNIDRFGWNARTTVDTSKDNFDGAHLEALLREQHKPTDDAITVCSTANTSRFAKANTFISGKRPSHHSTIKNQGKSRVEVSTHTETLKPYQDISKEINQMVKSLEEEMRAARDRIKEFEEDLADKYLQLEESAQACSVVEYEMALQDLDKERSDLELEKKRLQDYFTRKFALIRERKDNAQIVQQAAFSEMNQKIPEHSHQITQRMSTSKVVTKKEGKRGIDPKVAEKGWISLSSAKPETHNFHLRTKQTLSMQNFKTKITPKPLLEREKLEAKTVTSMNEHLNTQIYSNELKDEVDESAFISSGEGSAEVSFQKFKYRLHLKTLRFLDSKNGKSRTRIQDIMNSGPKPYQVELISMPAKGPSIEVDHSVHNGLSHWQLVRLEEIRIMNYEDERRKIFLAECSLEQSLTLSQELFQNVSTQIDTQPFQTPVPNSLNPPEDIDAAFAFLAKPRILLMNDRSAKEFTFSLINLTEDNSDDDEVKFAFEWFAESELKMNPQSHGLVLISDFISVQVSQLDSRLFLIQVRETPRALKNSKGRTTISVRCPSSSEAFAYVSSFRTLLNLTL